jgi:uncharacterized membrane protein YgdD (TMEM256/DUF423 family)
MKNARLWLVAGALLGFGTVALGAFGAHGLRGLVDAAGLANWRTAADYLGLHALAILACGLWLIQRPDDRLVHWAASALIAGVLLFSGSLFALVLSGQRALAMVTPFGGLTMLIGWGLLAAAGIRLRTPTQRP